MNDILRLNNLQFYGHHGDRPEEQVLGQPFQVDVEIELSVDHGAGVTDDLGDAVDYVDVVKAVKETVTLGRFNLIEALAEEIARNIGALLRPKLVTIRVRKPNPPIATPLDSVEVEITRSFV